MKISLINIGDEILIGQILNTNAQWLSEKISSTGAELFHHSAIADSRDAIYNELDYLLPKSDVIIMTGGLGPTVDDITKKVLAEYFNSELVVNEQVLEYLKTFFESRNRPFTESNQRQALLPKDCHVIQNNAGTAPGMLFEKEGKYVFSLPGVPKEMKAITEDFILGFIKEKINLNKSSVMIYKTLKTFGIVESSLADMLGDLSFLNNSTLAFLPSASKGVRLRISVKADNPKDGNLEIERIRKILYERAGEFIYGEDDDEVINAIGRLLKQKGETVSVAESCTGGMLGAAFTEISGSSEYFKGGIIAYDNEIKISELKVSKKTLDEFGAVSSECAKEMANNVRMKMKTDYALSITGIAGPGGGTPDKPVGTVWLGFATNNFTTAIKYNFGKNRNFNRERAMSSALSILYKHLKSM
jgi:nicotinamide-nucleotide amidase